MILKKINTKKGKRVMLFDDKYSPIYEVNMYLSFLSTSRLAYNTVLKYAQCIKVFYEYLYKIGENVNMAVHSKHPITWFSVFSDYLEYDGDKVIRKPETINYIVNAIYRYINYLYTDRVIDYKPEFINDSNRNQYTFLKEFLPKAVAKKRLTIRKVRTKREIRVKVELFEETIKIIIPYNKPSFYYNNYLDHSLTKKELVQLRNICLIELFAGTGLRQGEALGLKIEDLSEIQRNIIHIKRRENNENSAYAKTGDGFVIASNKIISDLNLLVYSNSLLYDSEYVFINYSGNNEGKALNANALESLFKNITKKMREKGVINNDESIHPHLFRHMFASVAMKETNNIFDVQDLLRHKSVSTTFLYLHADDKQKQRFIEIIDKEIFKYGVPENYS